MSPSASGRVAARPEEVRLPESAKFFDEITRIGHTPLLEKVTGAIRFELTDGNTTETWVVSIRKGDVSVHHSDIGIDVTCTVRAPRQLFNEVVAGRANAMAALLRGSITAEGDLELLLLFTRVLPGPPGAEHPRTRRQLVGSE
jgi:putative sterol carrier protein